MEYITDWFLGNYIELLGAVLGIAYVLFSIKQNILTWPVGLLTSALYVWVFFDSKLYADMCLQLYYLVVSIYGWHEWLTGGGDSNHAEPLKTSRLTGKLGIALTAVSLFLFILIWFVLVNFTDSNVPMADSLATSLSIVATWMLARKILEHWLIWIFVDAFSIGLFVYKELYPTVALFVVYTVMAFVGYREWKKEMNQALPLNSTDNQ